MEYTNHYNGTTGQVSRIAKPRQGPPLPDSAEQTTENIPAAQKSTYNRASNSHGDLLLMAVLLLMWLERRDEDALLTLIALLML